MTKIAKKLLLVGLSTFAMSLASCGGGNGGGDKTSTSKVVASSSAAGSSNAGGSSTSVHSGPTITFRLNYLSGDEDVYEYQYIQKNDCATRPATDPTREGYTFNGWHYDADEEELFDFDDPIKKSTRIWAHWLADLECTFDLNYSGAPEATKVKVVQKQAVARPADPTREGYQFIGWARNKDTLSGNYEEYFDFTSPILKATTLYAKWGPVGSAKAFRFEAEYSAEITDANNGHGLDGNTYSGGANGDGLIQPEQAGMNVEASNGWFVHFLYATGTNLIFKINSDAAGTAKIDMRLSAEYALTGTFKINSAGTNGASSYTIKVNGNSIDYGTITFTNIPQQGTGWKKFANYQLTASVALVKGENTVEMITSNNDVLNGTAIATAPMIDCLTFETTCNLSWGNAKVHKI